MTTTGDKTMNTLLERVYGVRAPRNGFSGPQEAVIVDVTGTGIGTVCTFTVPKVSTAYKYGPAPCPAGTTPGQRALALFVGAGSGDPWIVAVTSAPKPAGF